MNCEKPILLYLIFLCASASLLAQPNGGSLITTPNNNVIELIKEVFIKGDCKNVSNIQASGESVSFGEFENAGNVIGFPDGIILSTGDVKSAEGPNESVETTASFANNSMDEDLSKIATNQLFDVTIVEFDFVPLSNQVSFQYVFASEEYCEFVGTIFNDVFGFFVSGPGINGEFKDGAINVARLPDSEEFVSINTVNHILNNDSYVKNELEGDANSCQTPFSPNHVNTIEYDGFTVPLTARFTVIPCETYHLRLVVGDVGDDKLDSAVFLRSKSFDLGELAKVKAIVPTRTDTIAYENCADGQFVFTRPTGSNRNEALPIDFIIDNTSSALEGVDFQAIERTIIIPAGQNSIVLPIESFLDDEIENIETITLDLQQICKCEGGSQATLRLADARPPTISFPILNACADQIFTIQPQINDGVLPFTYQWNDGSTDSSQTELIQIPSNYTLTITDFCQNSISDSVLVNIQAIPSATLSGDVDYCEGQSDIALPLIFTGFPPWSFTYTIDGDSSILIDNIFDADFRLPIHQAGRYELIEFTDAACQGQALGMGLVTDIGMELTYEVIPPSCPKNEDGNISLMITGGEMPYDISWSTMVDNLLAPTNLKVGDYELTITDAQNCLLSTIINLPNPTNLLPICENTAVYVPNAFSPNGDGINDFFEISLPNPTSIQQVNTVQITDRWGNLVYTTNNAMPKWDGTFQGRLLNPAVFWYQIILLLENGETTLLQGDVSILR